MDQTHRYSAIAALGRSRELITAARVHESVGGVVQWLKAATATTGKPGKCHRNAMYHCDGRVSWMYANSNTAETISAWLDCADLLGDPELRGYAVQYADTLLADTEHGLYGGPHAEAQGIPWYWTDGGTYSGLYAMRMPFHFDRLYGLTGEQRYHDICDVIGNTLLACQLPSGIVSCAWNPQDGWMHEVRVGCRYLYAMATFATLLRITGEERYRTAYEKALSAIERLQNPDGSFFQMYEPRTGVPMDASVKMHFTAYLLNALAEAHAVTQEERLITIARGLGDHLAGIFYYRHAVPYCTGIVDNPGDMTEAESSIQDSVGGLLWLWQQVGEPVYLDVALKLWAEVWLHQIPADREPGWAGAVLRGVDPAQKQTIEGVPANRKHLHYDPTVIGRCDLWFATNHIFASRRLLEVLGAQAAVTGATHAPLHTALSAASA